MKLPYFVYDLIKTLNEKGYKAYVVGGAVRSHLLHEFISDYDLTTNARPEEVRSIFQDKYTVVDTGLKHGTVSVVNYNKKLVEITTFRNETSYSDSRHPDSVSFVKTYTEDSKRRDFTINAFYYDVNNDIILDPTGGNKDLKKKLIRAIGNPEDRFKEDALRILRAIRFEAVLKGFKMEEKTKEALFKCKDLLKNIAFERIREEFNKILLSDNFENIVIEYFDIFKIFIPEYEQCSNYQLENKVYEYDLLTHMLRSVSFAKKDLVIRLACAFHDIGKPIVAKRNVTEKNNQIKTSYLGHEKESSLIARNILNRLHYDSKTINSVCNLIVYHDYAIKENKRKDFISLLNRVGVSNIFDLICVKRADDLSHSNTDNVHEYYNKIFKFTKSVLKSLQVTSLKDLKLNGSDLIKLGYKPSSLFKTIFDDILIKVMNDELKNDKEELTNYVLQHYKLKEK